MTRTEHDTVIAIIERADLIAARYSLDDLNRLTCILDIENAHRQYPLDLAALLAADQAEFIHDFFGIRRHMDRDTGTLTDCFVPRFARRQVTP